MNQKVNKTAEKIKLIYEFNPDSPLFARVASILLEENNITEAIKILEIGIKKFPDYPAPYFILAIAKAYCGEDNESLELIKKGCTLLNCDETKNYYINKVQRIIEERNSLKEVKQRAIWKEEYKVNEENIEDKLEILAEQLSKARISYKPSEDYEDEIEIPEYTGKKIVSETLAKIYESQKNFKDAISVYKELININPEKSEYYKSKIKEISEIIDTGLV
ncbi:MAG: hypothetical protein N2249_07800 [Melioribacter sp.]|nr:hypothetical protein [Melioribacter sp.]